MGAEAVSRRPARVPDRLRLRQRDVDGPGRDPRRANAGGPGGVESRVGRRAGPARRFACSCRPAPRGRIDRLDGRAGGPAAARPALAADVRRWLLGGAGAIPVTRSIGPTPTCPAAVRRPRAGIAASSTVRTGSSSTPATLDRLTASLSRSPIPYARGTPCVELWEAMLEGRGRAGPRVRRPAGGAAARIRRAADAADARRTCARAFWRFTAADDRQAIAPRIEAVLRAGLAKRRHRPVQERLVLDATAAQSLHARRHRLARTRLAARRQHRRACRSPSPTRLIVAADLALRDVADARAILHDAVAAIQESPTGADRFAFVLPALSAVPPIASAFFEGLKDADNRRHEAWVLDAARYLHHPLRAAASKQLVLPALGLAARDPADRRHLLPEAVGRRDAERVSVGPDGRGSARVHRPPAAGLSAAAALGPAVVSRSAVPRGHAPDALSASLPRRVYFAGATSFT